MPFKPNMCRHPFKRRKEKNNYKWGTALGLQRRKRKW
jgi:hypothetical protein